MSVLIEIGIILLLVLLNGVFAMGELAVVSSRRARLLALQKAGMKGASTALSLAENPERMLPTVQIGITLVGILAGAFGGARLSSTLEPVVAKVPFLAPYADDIAFGVVVLVITYLSLILGELVPKTLALRNPEAVASRLAALLLLLSRVASPAVWLLSSSSALVLRLLGASQATETAVTEEEVKAVVAEGAEAGALEREERQMIERVLRLADKPVRALMTPRNEVVWLDRSETPEELRTRVREGGVSRYVVADGRVDNVVGVVAVKDLLDELLAGHALSLSEAMRQPLVLPDTLPALDALERMRTDKIGMALVMDEYGSFEGIITDSDLLEAIVGELGEPEPEPAEGAVERHDGSLLVDGMMPSDELKARLDLPTLPQEGSYHTVAGLLLALLQRVPKEGDRIAWSGWQFEVVDMDGRRVDKVLVSPETVAG
ncbi:hemolysin family protein [Roseomonas gilardii subsp. gilardii]|uniref:hemolysin family protein n=1 Tax=Roseomonas gilardii TaxID=257708 RepID=UPI001FFADC48|nr:hemolysin family protein [Roseomonas gilardii]UPG71576.1 hemolysin family protein [Roseomonas gilardii subsp. gilardii]